MLKRDQDSSSVASGDGSNTDSGRGASEEGETSALGTRLPAVGGTDGQVQAPNAQLAPVPEDLSCSSCTGNQVVPGSFCDSSMSSFLSHHNSTIGSYLPPEHLRAASRTSYSTTNTTASGQRHYGGPLKTFQNSTVSSTGLDTITDSRSHDSSLLDVSSVSQGHSYRGTSPQKCNTKLKSILKAPPAPLGPGNTSCDLATPQSQNGMDNYLKHRMNPQLERRAQLRGASRRPHSSSDCELSDIEESEVTESAIKYSCIDVSDILNSKLSAAQAGSPRDVDGEAEDDDDMTTTSGSYTVDPKELCDQIDELFFKNIA